MSQHIKDLYEGYIKNFPENNASQPVLMPSVLWADSIVTSYYSDLLNIEITIAYDYPSGGYDIKKTENGKNTVSVIVRKDKKNNIPELTVKAIYEVLAITKNEIKGAEKVEENNLQNEEA